MKTNESIINNETGIEVSDLKLNYRYTYYVLDNPGAAQGAAILCEGKAYEITIRNPVITDRDIGKPVIDIKNPEFHIVDVESGNGHLVIKSSDTDIEKKIVAFTKSLIIAEDIMNLIDMFFLASNKTIYR